MDTKLPKILRNSSETLLAVLDKLVRYAELIPFGPTPNGIPKLSASFLDLRKEGSDGKPVPSIPQNWSNLVLPLFETVQEYTDDFKEQYKKAQEWAEEHPGLAILGFCVIGVTLYALVCPGAVYQTLLAAIGFGSKGVRALSFAAKAQAPNIAKKSFHAYLTSGAMGGYGTIPLDIITRIITVAGVAGMSLKWLAPKESLPPLAKL